MTYGERLADAMEHGEFHTQKALAVALTHMLRSEGIEKEIPEQTIQKALKSDGSKYTSRFARLCGVDPDWLEHGRGEMIKKQSGENSNWPFDFEEIRFLRLSPTKKRFIERAVVTMIESFEAEAGDSRKKKRKAQR